MINDILINILIIMNVISRFKHANGSLHILDIMTIILCLTLVLLNILRWIQFYINNKKGIVEYVKDDGIQYVFLLVTPILLGVQLATLLY